MNWLLRMILYAALVLRLGFNLTHHDGKDPHEDLSLLPDQLEYLQIARNLQYESRLVFFDPRFGQEIYAYRTPGYPAFIALFQTNPRTVRIAQSFLDGATLVAAYLIARKFLGERAGLTAAAAVAFNPFLIYFCGLLLSETLYTAMLAWGLWLLISGGRVRWSAGIVVLAAAALVRPSGVGLAVLLAGASLILNRGVWPTYRILPRLLIGGAIGLVVCTATLLPWALRNARHPQLGRWIWTTTNEGITLYDGLNDAADGSSAQEKFLPELLPELSRMSEVQRNDFFRQRAWQWAPEHPGRTALLAGKKVLRTWSPVPLSAQNSRPAYMAAGLGYYLPFWALVVAGLLSRSLPRPAKLLLLLPAIYFTAAHAISVGSMRYRLPADVPMSIVAAAGAMHLAARFGFRRADSADSADSTASPQE